MRRGLLTGQALTIRMDRAQHPRHEAMRRAPVRRGAVQRMRYRLRALGSHALGDMKCYLESNPEPR